MCLRARLLCGRQRQGPAQAPDVITVGAFSYEVKSAEQWGDVGAYWKCLAQKLGH